MSDVIAIRVSKKLKDEIRELNMDYAVMSENALKEKLKLKS